MSIITHESALENFNHQIQFALDHSSSHGLSYSQFNNIVIAGLGGSGIGGRIVKTIFSNKSSLPIEVISDYSLPSYTSKNTFVILSSYSGTTEETLAMYHQAKSLGCQMVCITSGGELFELAQKDQVKTYMVELGYQPRMALGFSLSYVILILSELFNLSLRTELEGVLSIYNDSESMKNKAKEMIEFFSPYPNNKFTIVTDNQTEAIGVRFCQQIQENAKTEAFVNVLPEANHNVFETYYGELPSNFIFINSNTNDRNNGRFAYLKKLLVDTNNKVFELPLQNYSLIEIYKCLYITDWFSIYLSNQKGKDNMSVPNIMGLKGFLKTF